MTRPRAILALPLAALLAVLLTLWAQCASACELLVLTKDTGDTNGTSWTRGDIITNQADGFAWSAKETLPIFWKIKVTDATVAQWIRATSGRDDAEKGKLT